MVDKVLLLDSFEEPLNLCTWKRAIVLVLKGKAEKIDDFDSMTYDYTKLPSIIKLRYNVAAPNKALPFSRKNIFIRDDYTCQYCGKKTFNLTLDHVFPKSRGGPLSWENIVAACPDCNCRKADRTPEEAGMVLLNIPKCPDDYMDFELSKYFYDYSSISKVG